MPSSTIVGSLACAWTVVVEHASADCLFVPFPVCVLMMNTP